MEKLNDFYVCNNCGATMKSNIILKKCDRCESNQIGKIEIKWNRTTPKCDLCNMEALYFDPLTNQNLCRKHSGVEK